MTAKGYGQIRVGGRAYRAHRLAYELRSGPLPRGAILLHSCDNPACINLDHLTVGTQADNTADMMAKARGFTGDACSWAKLSEAQVIEVRQRLCGPDYRRGDIAAMARKLGVSVSTISDIRIGRKWKHAGQAVEPAP